MLFSCTCTMTALRTNMNAFLCSSWTIVQANKLSSSFSKQPNFSLTWKWLILYREIPMHFCNERTEQHLQNSNWTLSFGCRQSINWVSNQSVVYSEMERQYYKITRASFKEKKYGKHAINGFRKLWLMDNLLSKVVGSGLYLDRNSMFWNEEMKGYLKLLLFTWKKA